ncbi:MAG TPA: hypothetical protein VGD64_11185 [Acidisarcina sp.]
MEIDHNAQASTLEGVKRIFETGLASLVTRHLTSRGNLDRLLKSTPESTWSDLWHAGKVFKVSSTTFKEREVLKALPFNGISYFEQLAWAAKVSSIRQGKKMKSEAGSPDQLAV